MRYDEITIGTAYYHATSTKWRERNEGNRVVIDSLTRYRQAYYGGGSIMDAKGQYLIGHTEIIDPDGTVRAGTKIKYRMSALRGTWDEIAPTQAAVQATRDAAWQAARDARNAREDAIRDALGRLGIEWDGMNNYVRGYLISADDLQSLADRIEQLSQYR